MDREAKVVSAIVSNVWVAYERHTGEGLSSRRRTKAGMGGGSGNVYGGGGNAGGGGGSGARPSATNGRDTDSIGDQPGIHGVVGPTGVTKEEEGLRNVMVQCEHGKLSITNVSQMLLCLVASEDVEFGILKLKVCGFTLDFLAIAI
ncbi:hypothetical protein HK101_001658 [Irineochytrium annulatum]|nr:hypothetical protein HK101_001658 [Irineochytrium annulatum]